MYAEIIAFCKRYTNVSAAIMKTTRPEVSSEVKLFGVHAFMIITKNMTDIQGRVYDIFNILQAMSSSLENCSSDYYLRYARCAANVIRYDYAKEHQFPQQYSDISKSILRTGISMLADDMEDKEILFAMRYFLDLIRNFDSREQFGIQLGELLRDKPVRLSQHCSHIFGIMLMTIPASMNA